ncbi:hypothetical protein [Qipengyuania nanhaisediminis]|uniref:hypothetical protein n=1 Tax=Qipengyuania nanhaisediminis TaxID=604088 RepID=UPI0038B2E8E4
MTNLRATPRQATSAVAHTAAPPSPDDPLLTFDPVPHVAPRSNSITPDLQRAFIAHLAATGIVAEAARHIGKSLEAIYKLRSRPGSQGFRAAWEAAVDRGVARLEAGALARAIEGEERLVIAGGEVVGTEIRHKDALTMFFLRSRLPQRYGAHAASGALEPGHPAYDALAARLRAEWEDEQRAERMSEENREANRAFFAGLKARWRSEWEAEREAAASGGNGQAGRI